MIKLSFPRPFPQMKVIPFSSVLLPLLTCELVLPATRKTTPCTEIQDPGWFPVTDAEIDSPKEPWMRNKLSYLSVDYNKGQADRVSIPWPAADASPPPHAGTLPGTLHYLQINRAASVYWSMVNSEPPSYAMLCVGVHWRSPRVSYSRNCKNRGRKNFVASAQGYHSVLYVRLLFGIHSFGKFV